MSTSSPDLKVDKHEADMSSRDLGKVKDPQALPDIFTSYRKMMEPLRDVSRDVLPPVSYR